MKYAIYYIVTERHNNIYSQFEYLSQLNYDIYVFLPNSFRLSGYFFSERNAKVFIYNSLSFKYSDELINKNNDINVYKLIEYYNNKININDYDYIYLIEPSFRYSNNIIDLFNSLNTCDADYLASFIDNLGISGNTSIYVNKYNELYPDNIYYKNFVKSFYGGFCRISVKSLNIIINTVVHNNLLYFLFDIGYPTLCNIYNLKIASLNKRRNQYDCFDYCDFNTFLTNKDKNITLYKLNNMHNKMTNSYNVNNTYFNKYINTYNKSDISIILYLYNCEYSLNNVLKPLLKQNFSGTYNIYCIDDCSSDKTLKLLYSYKEYDNINIIPLDKKIGYSNALNLIINDINSKYIINLSSNSIVDENFIQEYYDLLITNEYDLIIPNSTVLHYNKGARKFLENTSQIEYINLNNINNISINNNILFTDFTICTSKDILSKLPFLYEEYFEHIENYKLLLTYLLHDLNSIVYTPNNVTIIQNTKKPTNNRILSIAKYNKLLDNIKNINDCIYKNESNITAVIAFKNENVELEKTIASIRSTTVNMPIILIDDNSQDNYDYCYIAKKYNCKYIRNNKSKGCAISRNIGVKNVETDYFILLDAHMRMYDINWDYKFTEYFKLYGDDNLFFGKTNIINKENDKYLINENNNKKIKNDGSDYYGAVLNKYNRYPFSFSWNTNNNSIHTQQLYNETKDSTIMLSPIALGACYAMSVKLWNKINGLEGLHGYGQDEILLSLKTWLSGAKVILINNITFGHLYRTEYPYIMNNLEKNSNYIYCNYLFSTTNEEFELYNKLLIESIGINDFNNSYELFMKDFNKTKEFKEHFYKNIATKTLKWFYKFNYNTNPEFVNKMNNKYELTVKKIKEVN